jgi:transposase
MSFEYLQTKRHFVSNKIIVGIDPARRKHQAAVINSLGITIGTSFSFKTNHHGYHHQLFKQLNTLDIKINPNNCVFAIERSCNLWQTLAHYLHRQGYTVVLVSPVTTRRSRPFFNHDFSKTDPKDALLVASNARDGYFDYFQDFSQRTSTPCIN